MLAERRVSATYKDLPGGQVLGPTFDYTHRLLDFALAAEGAAPAAAPQADANAAARRDYELAERVGTREAWDYFIATYPGSFYAKLAQAQRNKLAAEEARLAATEKAKAAQDEQTRLAIEGAKKAEQAKAAAQAKAAEQARVASELAKKAEDARLEAERARAVAKARSAEDAKAAAKDTSKDTSKDTPREESKVAALTPNQSAPKADAPVVVADIPKQLQIELRRVGCNTSATSDAWTPAAQKAMELFNKNAGMTLDVKVASADSLDAVKSRPGRICPLICEHGYKADGDRCTKITCRSGYAVGDDNTCERIEVKKPKPPVAKREETTKPPKAAESRSTSANSEAKYATCRARFAGSGNMLHPSIVDREMRDCMAR
jgi:hypothetical protein